MNSTDFDLKTSEQIRTCQEASMFSTHFYVPCGKPATKIVQSQRDGKAYDMCDICADHNIRNRGMELVGEIK